MVGEEGETREGLLALGKSHGFEVTDHKLTRWRQKGLLPRPEQRPLGKAHGTRTIYPHGTGEQLLALCAVHAGERSLDRVAWHLWWLGYDVSLEPVRSFIASVVAEWDEQAQGLIDRDTGELSDSGWKMVDQAATNRVGRPLSGMRKRVGKKWFDTFVRVALEALLGRFQGFVQEPKKDSAEDDERRIVKKGMGLRQVGDKPWPKVDIEACLKDMGWLASRGSLRQELGHLTDEQMNEARDEARSWLVLLGGYSLMFERWSVSWGPFGFVAAMGRMLRDMGPQEQALFTLVWAVGRFRGPADLREGLEAHGKPTQEMEDGLRDWELLGWMGDEVPAMSKVLTPRRIKAGFVAAFRGSQELERFERELDEVGRKIAETEE